MDVRRRHVSAAGSAPPEPLVIFKEVEETSLLPTVRAMRTAGDEAGTGGLGRSSQSVAPPWGRMLTMRRHRSTVSAAEGPS